MPSCRPMSVAHGWLLYGGDDRDRLSSAAWDCCRAYVLLVHLLGLLARLLLLVPVLDQSTEGDVEEDEHRALTPARSDGACSVGEHTWRNVPLLAAAHRL